MIPEELKKLIDALCTGSEPNDEQLSLIMDKMVSLNADPAETTEYMQTCIRMERQTESVLYDVYLDETGSTPLMLIKAIMDITHLPLGEAKALMDNSPSIISSTKDKEEAEKHCGLLIKANGCAHISQRAIKTSHDGSSNSDFNLTEYESMSLDEQITAAEKLLEFGDKEKSLQGVALFEYIGNNLARKIEDVEELERLVDIVCVARYAAVLRHFPEEAPEAFKELKTLADKGCESAYEPLAEAYSKGLGTNADAAMGLYYALLHRKATAEDDSMTPENVVDNLIGNMVGGFEHINVFSKNDKYMVCKYLVTQKEWEVVMGENPSWQKSPNFPVVNITYAEAEEFVYRVNKIARSKGYEFMIPPTDWQWLGYQKKCAEEFKHLDKDIIRAGVSAFAWYDANSEGHLHNVGELQAAAGIYDAAGLVYEMGQTKKYNTYRYGAFNEPVKHCFGDKSSGLMYADKRYDNLGLRLICMED